MLNAKVLQAIYVCVVLMRRNREPLSNYSSYSSSRTLYLSPLPFTLVVDTEHSCSLLVLRN